MASGWVWGGVIKGSNMKKRKRKKRETLECCKNRIKTYMSHIPNPFKVGISLTPNLVMKKMSLKILINDYNTLLAP